MKKNWSTDQKVKLVVGFTNSGMTKKAYCEKYGANPDVFRRWQKDYQNGTLKASGTKSAKNSVSTKQSVKRTTTKKVVSKKKPFILFSFSYHIYILLSIDYAKLVYRPCSW